MPGRYNPEGDIFAQGINVLIRVDLEDANGGDPQVIGFVETYEIRAQITNQKAECIGEILPVSIDPTSVAVTVSLTGFIPTSDLINKKGIKSVRGGGKAGSRYILKAFNPNVDNLVDVQVITKIPYLDLWDDKHGSIIGSTSWLVPNGYVDSGQGKGYVKSNVTLEGIGYYNGDDYKSEI
jgi:hypothetical protein